MEATPLIVIGLAVALLVVIAILVWRRTPAAVVGESVPAAPKSTLGSTVRRALGSSLDEGTWHSIEEALIAADVGVEASSDIVAEVRKARPGSVEEARRALAGALKSEFADTNRDLELQRAPAVMLVVGVNGTGKTTSIAKLAKRLQDAGMSVILGAADTFRAAGAEQLQAWGRRLGVRVVRGDEGGDPASVAFDTVDSARAAGVDVVIIDTAGRLHDKKNLMSELQKIHRVAGGPDVSEVLLVLDATAGQNGLVQVREFLAAVPVTGIVLTKLDGTARGGIVVAVERTLGVPVKLVGVGEGIDDLLAFDPDRFVDSLLE